MPALFLMEALMSKYKLELKQIVDYPRCRIYRQFIQQLIADRSIRTSGGSGLFYFTVLSSYANFRTSYKRIDGISYTIYPGEWLCRVSSVSASGAFNLKEFAGLSLDYLHLTRTRKTCKIQNPRLEQEQPCSGL